MSEAEAVFARTNQESVIVKMVHEKKCGFVIFLKDWMLLGNSIITDSKVFNFRS